MRYILTKNTSLITSYFTIISWEFFKCITLISVLSLSIWKFYIDGLHWKSISTEISQLTEWKTWLHRERILTSLNQLLFCDMLGRHVIDMEEYVSPVWVSHEETVIFIFIERFKCACDSLRWYMIVYLFSLVLISTVMILVRKRGIIVYVGWVGVWLVC